MSGDGLTPLLEGLLIAAVKARMHRLEGRAESLRRTRANLHTIIGRQRERIRLLGSAVADAKSELSSQHGRRRAIVRRAAEDLLRFARHSPECVWWLSMEASGALAGFCDCGLHDALRAFGADKVHAPDGADGDDR